MKIKGVLSYIFSASLAVLFALYLSGRIGWFLFAVFLITPIAGALSMVLCAKGLKITMTEKGKIYSKGEEGEYIIAVEKNSVFSLCPVKLIIAHSPNVFCSETVAYVFPGDSVSLSFKALTCGRGYISVENALVGDFSGSFYKKIKGFTSCKNNIDVMPDVAELKDKNQLLMYINKIAADADINESEESVETYSFTGIAGYDLRDYSPGDPIKRINWKQSVKRDRLMVRLDEAVQEFDLCLVLDSYFDESKCSFSAEKATEAMLESYLGVADTIVGAGYSLSCYFCIDGMWNTIKATGNNHIGDIRVVLAAYSFKKENSEYRIPQEATGGDKVVIMCTADDNSEPIENMLIYRPLREVAEDA